MTQDEQDEFLKEMDSLSFTFQETYKMCSKNYPKHAVLLAMLGAAVVLSVAEGLRRETIINTLNSIFDDVESAAPQSEN
jgi:hypothetical protein